MKILLINSPIWLDKPGVIAPVEPLGILYLAAVLLKAGHDVRVKDLTVDGYSRDAFLAELEDANFGAIGFSCRTASYAATMKIVNDMSSMKKRPFVILGGNHPTALPEETLNDLPETIVVRGEGEKTVVELFQYLERRGIDRNLVSVKGVSFKCDGKVFHAPDRELVEDLDTLPFPARHLLPMEKYNWAIGGKSAVNILSSRGCPFNCIYCFKKIFKNRIRYRSIANIMAEIEEVGHELKRQGIYFVDDHFTCDNDRLDKFLVEVKSRSLDIKWRCLTRVDGFRDAGMLRRMKDLGCDTIIFGAESGDEETLRLIRKGTTLEQSRSTILAAREAGINLKVNFMLGFPWETYRSVYNTLKFCADLPPVREYAFYFVTPFPGTEIWDKYCNGRSFKWEDFTEFNAFFKGKTIAEDDYRNLLIYASLYIFRRHFLGELFKPRTIGLFFSSVRRNGLKKALFSLTQAAAPFIDEDNPFRAVQGLLFELRDRPDKPIAKMMAFFLNPFYLQLRILRERRLLKR